MPLWNCSSAFEAESDFLANADTDTAIVKMVMNIFFITYISSLLFILIYLNNAKNALRSSSERSIGSYTNSNSSTHMTEPFPPVK